MRVLLILLVCLVALKIGAQPFGGTPAAFRWQQINTDTVRIIFPEGYDAQAQRIVGIIHGLQQKDSSRHHKINLVIRDQTLISNGYVGLAPWRTEWYITPPRQLFTLGANRFSDLLALHEWKHVQQYNRLNTGVSRFARLVLGEQGQALANALSVPDWFFEGEAVDNETRYSHQGRGSLPLFMQQLPAWWATQPPVRYDYLRNGSLRKYVPNHYALGYLLVAYGRKQYGNAFWPTVSSQAAAFRGWVYPFQHAIQQQTGQSFSKFVQLALQDYRTTMPKVDSMQWVTAVSKKGLTDYLLPIKIDQSAVWVLKKNDRAIPAFYRVNADGTETLLANRQIAADDAYTYRNGKIIYASLEPDMRWGNHDYTRIVVLSTQTGQTETLLKGVKMVTPDISEDGNQILVSEIPPGKDASIVRLTKAGRESFRLSMPTYQLSEPRFAANSAHFFATIRDNRGYMSIIQVTPGSADSVRWLMPLTNRVIAHLQVQSDTLLFTTSHQQQDEIWAVLSKTGSIYRLSRSTTGIYQGALLNSEQLLASVFTGSGFRLAMIEPLWEKVQPMDALVPIYKNLPYEKDNREWLATVSPGNYPVTRYQQSARPFNFHSYRPFFELPEYSFTVYGENVLKTFQHQLQYVYNQNEGSHRVGYDGIYGGTFVQPLAGIQQTWHRTARWNADTVVNFQEMNAYLGGRLPLNLSGGNRYRWLTLQSSLNFRQIQYTGIAQKWLNNFDQVTVESSLQYSSQVQQSRQQIFPQYAHAFSLTYKTSAAPRTAYQWLARGSVWLPGFSPVHHWVITAAAQTRDTLKQYYFTNRFPFARGYQAVDYPDLIGGSVSYHFPVAYPERGWAQLVYLLRVRSAVFYDHTIGISRRTGLQRTFNSVGTEWYFDTRWWNQLPVSIGFRYSRLLQPEFVPSGSANRWEIILPVNLLY